MNHTWPRGLPNQIQASIFRIYIQIRKKPSDAKENPSGTGAPTVHLSSWVFLKLVSLLMPNVCFITTNKKNIYSCVGQSMLFTNAFSKPQANKNINALEVGNVYRMLNTDMN